MYETADPLYAVPTAEVPLTNFFRTRSWTKRRCRCTAAPIPVLSPRGGQLRQGCPRPQPPASIRQGRTAERVHPGRSYEELDALRGDAEALRSCWDCPTGAADVRRRSGFAQAKKYDLEVWAAGQKRCSRFQLQQF